MYIIKNLTDGNYFSFRLNDTPFFTSNFEIVSRFETAKDAQLCIENSIDSNDGFDLFGAIDCEVVKELELNPLSVTELATKFSIILQHWLTSEQIAEINRLNLIHNDMCCSTHDFCDPNQAMLDVFSDLFGRDFDQQNPVECDLTNEAWTLAKKRGFVVLVDYITLQVDGLYTEIDGESFITNFPCNELARQTMRITLAGLKISDNYTFNGFKVTRIETDTTPVIGSFDKNGDTI